MLSPRGIAAGFAAFMLLAGLLPSHTLANPAALYGTSCAVAGANSTIGPDATANNFICDSGTITWKYPKYTLQSAAASAGASCSGTAAGTLRWNTTLSRVEFCNGSVWTMLVPTQTSGITAPAGSGYFVLTKTTYNGNLGGLSGANAKCLTELATTNTTWMGYSTANSNGQLIASKVKAFLCDGAACTNLMPLTTYYFAYAGSSGTGGASFTTDASGFGPGDSNPWSAANYFGGTYNYWLHRTSTSNTQWSNTTQASGYSYGCGFWTNSTNGAGASGGLSTYSDANRWVGFTSGSAQNCDNTYNLICLVNP